MSGFCGLGRQFLSVLLMVLVVVQPAFYPVFAQDESRPSLTTTSVDYQDPIWDELSLQAIELGSSPGSAHSLDMFRLLSQKTIAQELREKLASAVASSGESSEEAKRLSSAIKFARKTADRVDLRKLSVVVRDSDGHEIARVFANDFQAARLIETQDLSQSASFEILIQDVPLHRFDIKVEAIRFANGKLLFVERGAFNAATTMSNIGFIDLDYFASAVGRVDLPIFRLPIKSRSPITQLQIEGGDLYANDIPVPSTVIDYLSAFQQTAWNLSVSLADPSTAASAAEVVNEFSFYFEKAYELAGEDVAEQVAQVTGEGRFTQGLKSYFEQQLKSRVRMQDARLEVEKQKTEFDSQKQAWERSVRAGQGDLPAPQVQVQEPNFPTEVAQLDSTLNQMGKNLIVQRKLTARLRLLWASLTLPQPIGAPKVETALELIKTGLGIGAPSYGGELNEGLRQFINTRPVKMAGTAFAVGLFLFMGQDSVRTVLSHFLEASTDMLSLAWQSFAQTVSGFSADAMYQQYVADGRLAKLGVGATAAFSVLFMVLGIPHFMVNGYKLYKDLKSRPQEELAGLEAPAVKPSLWQRLKNLKSAFIARQKKEESSYLSALSSSSYIKQDTEGAGFTAEDNVEVESLLTDLRQKNASWIGRFMSGMKSWKIAKALQASPDTFMGALRHFIFSSASLTHSGTAYAKMWNAWFGFRSFVFSPRLWLTFLYYPNYWSRIFQKGQQGFAIPTEANGGLRPFWQEHVLRLRGLFGSAALKSLRAAEDKLLPVEAQIQKVVLQRSFGALLRHIDTPDDLKKFFETNGVDSITDETIYQLSGRHRSFFQLYFWRLQEEVTANFLRTTLGDEANLRNLSAESLEKIKCSPLEAEAHVEAYLANHPDFESEISAQIDANEQKVERALINLNLKNVKRLDSKTNRQVARMKLAEQQMANPQAMARAVRATKAAIMVDKPLELVMRFVLLAAIDTGIMVPMHDEMFSENSWFYLGRYPFLTGYVVALIQGVLADIWMKIQTDAKNEGTFGEVPEGEDAKMSFLQWYKKQTFHNPQNRWWENQKYNTAIVFANMKAALVTYLVTNLLTLGRFDLDTYFTGYLLYYLTPLMGFSMMIEQGFEFASFYYAKDIPKKYRNHPEVEKYLNSRIGYARIWFNLYYKIYENFSGLWLDALQTIQTKVNGTRAFARILLFGYTPTELVGNSLDAVADTLGKVPGARFCAKALRKIVTNKYTDGTHLNSDP